MNKLTYTDLIAAKPFKCWSLTKLADGREPENTNNDHSSIGGKGSKFYAAVDTMYPKVAGEKSTGRWSAPGQAPVVSPCWGYVTQTRDYTNKNTGGLYWINILLGEPPPVPLPGEKWDPGWADIASGWCIMLVHFSELYCTKRTVVRPGQLITRLMDKKGGDPFVPHVHNSLHTVDDRDANHPKHDPRLLYYDGLPAIEEGWEWDEAKGLWSKESVPEDDHSELLGTKILTILDAARNKIAELV